MAKTNAPLLAFNRGLVSTSALTRVDVDRIRLSAEIMENWLPKTAGSMFLRPGTGYLGTSRNNAFGIDIPFVASTTDTALIEMADGKMRVRVNDALVSRVAVATTISNSTFATSASWTDGSTNGGTLAFGSGLVLNAANVGGLALCRRQITVSGGDANKRHALNINITRGPVTFRCGSTSGGDEYISETPLRTGVHSLAFTPAGSFWVQFQSDLDVSRVVASCQVATTGTMELDIPYAAADLPYVRWDQSADVLFLACDGYQQRRIERRSTDSWSIALYAPENGPFFSGRSAAVKMKIAATNGNTTLTCDKPFFKSTHVGALFRLFNGGVAQTYNLGAADAYTDPFRVTGVIGVNYDDRDWTYTVAGTWVGTLRWLRSFDGADTGFKIFRKADGTVDTDITAPVTNISNVDEDDNAIVWYKLGFAPGDYTSGTATVSVIYDGGGGSGICRVLAINSATEAVVEVLERFSNTTYTDNWQEGIWSDKQGWPSAVAFDKGRLGWAGKSRFIFSVSDDFENFDPDFEGDSAPINRTLGSGPVDTINFMLSLSRPIIGTPGAEFSIKSSSFDEPLTPQNAQAGTPSTQGSRQGVAAVKIDGRGIFAQRSGKRLFELIFDPGTYEYSPRDLTLLCPDLTGSANVVGMAIQRQPDSRIHVWLDDGTVVLLTYEPSEDVTCWSRWQAGGAGFIEGVSVLPGEDEDQVFYRVRRTVSGSTVRYLDKVALESECLGGTMNKMADSFVIIPAVTGTTVTGLSHLNGLSVVAWGAGKYLGAYMVSAGSITLSAAVTAADVMVGLPYTALYRSTKLAYAASAGTALSQIKRVNYVGLIMGRVHNDGIEVGRDFSNMDKLPRLYQGRPVTADEIFTDYEEPATSFGGEWKPDSRLCIRATAPKPCVLNAAVVTVETNDKV
ncbi:hypothetical protein LB521_09200 [Mesorhizobium sp. BR-1-1-8]|uniref:hypothetical protein n=1 Tax=unclassified Mesorhizobium TaxID=325217 RepID=UPI00112EAAB0|nr:MULTISPECIES: hypothetical protein [unclassified Mesorhizobium]MBZ9981334.1 hypothetical protein [Mesorhizobium sp. BR-1-1-8]TPL33724.1 hypothetical protein FJ947_19235 [Mesorhizobium sp. B2-4-8]